MIYIAIEQEKQQQNTKNSLERNWKKKKERERDESKAAYEDDFGSCNHHRT